MGQWVKSSPLWLCVEQPQSQGAHCTCLGHIYKCLDSNPAPNPRVSGLVSGSGFSILLFFRVLTNNYFSKYLGLKWGKRGRKKKWDYQVSDFTLVNIHCFHLIFKLFLQIIFSTTLSLLHKCVPFIFIYDYSETLTFLRTETMPYFVNIISFILSLTCTTLQAPHTRIFMRGTEPALK